jgi:tetratricopeptide (TPR) repeat protein
MFSPEVRKLIAEQKLSRPVPYPRNRGEGNKKIEMIPSPPLKDEAWSLEKPPQGWAKESFESFDTFRCKGTRARGPIGKRFHVHNAGSARFTGFFLLLFLPLHGVAQSPLSPTPYQEALALIQKQQLQPGIALLRKILEQSPRDIKAHNLMGIALTAFGKIEEANTHFQTAIELNPKFYPALKNLAINEMTLKKTEDAKAHLMQVLELDPKDLTVHLALGEIQFSSKQFGKAVKHYDQSGDLPFKDSGLLLNYGTSCAESGHPEKAVILLEKLPPDATPLTHFQAGLMLVRLAKYENAAKQFELARNGYPDPYQVSFNLTLAYTRSGNFPAAIRTAQESISQGHLNAELYNLLAQAYEGNGQTVEAYEALRTATKLEPRDENNYLDLAILCADHANYDLALEIMNIGIGNISESDRMYLQRGAILAMKGESARATEDFEIATKLAPQKSLVYLARGITLVQAGETAKAVELLRQRKAVSPGDYMVHYILGETLNREGPASGSMEESEALQALENSIRLNPAFPASRAALGKALLRRGEVDQAIKELEKACELDSRDVTASYQLALAYRKKGDLAQAEKLMAKVDRAKSEDRDKFMNQTLLRLVREGSKSGDK